MVPGVEISTMAGGTDIHVLGYYVDHRDPVFLERLAALRRTREKRNEKILAKLRELGIELAMEEVIAVLGGRWSPMRASDARILRMRWSIKDMPWI